MRRALVLILAAATLVALGLMWRSGGTGPAGLHVSGDGAPAVRAALPPSMAEATRPEAAAVEAILLDAWIKTRHLPGATALCGAACGNDAGLVRVIALRPGGTRKTVFLNVDTLDDPACAASVLSAEMSALRPAPPACAPSLVVRTRWHLPFGLGAF